MYVVNMVQLNSKLTLECVSLANTRRVSVFSRDCCECTNEARESVTLEAHIEIKRIKDHSRVHEL